MRQEPQLAFRIEDAWGSVDPTEWCSWLHGERELDGVMAQINGQKARARSARHCRTEDSMLGTPSLWLPNLLHKDHHLRGLGQVIPLQGLWPGLSSPGLGSKSSPPGGFPEPQPEIMTQFCFVFFTAPRKWKCWSLSPVWLCNSMDCSLPGSSVRGILQARILEWVAIPFSRGSSQPRDQTWIFFFAGRFQVFHSHHY